MGVFGVGLMMATGLAGSAVYAGSEWLGEASSGLNDYLELKRCMDEERESGSHKYTRCSKERGQRLEQTLGKNQLHRMKENEEQRELEDLARMPHAVEEMQARFGQVITFEECMSVYDDREIYGKGEITRNDARGWCTDIVKRVRNYCLTTRDNHCADKGFLREDETAGALRHQQQEATERRHEQEQQRRKAMREQWIKQGGTPGICPGSRALLDKNHPCNY